MGQLNALRKIIREEVRAVFQEELAGILKEAIIANRSSQPIVEATVPKKPTIPNTLNNRSLRQKLVAPVLNAGNPLNALLAETAMTMTEQDFAQLGGVVQSDVPVVDSMNDMIATARKSSNLEAIEINSVPDFTAIMAKMQANGEV
jgi:hypothetical protein